MGLSCATLHHYDKVGLQIGERQANSHHVYTYVDRQHLPLMGLLQVGPLSLLDYQACIYGKLERGMLG